MTCSGLQVLTASDGEEALSSAEASHPDVILMDVAMPKLTGIEVCAALRHRRDLRGIPVILLTGDPAPETRRAGLSAGAAAFMQKPFRPIALLNLLSQLTGNSAPWSMPLAS